VHTAHFWNNFQRVRLWNNFHQVRFWNNFHQVRFWNNFHQVRSKSSDWKTYNIKVWEQKKRIANYKLQKKANSKSKNISLMTIFQILSDKQPVNHVIRFLFLIKQKIIIRRRYKFIKNRTGNDLSFFLVLYDNFIN
jgi:hypothetical protein